ncbi:hypothetical protein BDZ97DRAFT_1825074 [Flammula alnicola]|nr:hypothetical protein BDZ97DRAFT_1825074 [Flammula alnicola]
MGDALMVSQLTEIRAAAVKEWIARSGTLPLSISLCGWDILPPIDYCKIFFQWILPSSSRWKNISLACPAASLTDFRAIPPSEVPILQALSFTISHSKATPDAEWNDCGLFQASSLRKFSISGINTDISYLPLNWSKLTHLSLNGDTLNGDQWSPMGSVIDAFTRLLERCFGLVSCRVYVGYGANPGNRTEFPTFSLPLLESLWVFEMEQIPGFLAAFDAPKLRKIEYWTPRSSTAGPSFLTRLLSNSGGGVQEVSTDPRLFSAHDLVKYLHLCPSLTSLSLSLASPGSSFPTSPMPHDMSDSPISDSLLQSFAHSKADDECLCPNLEKFTCLTEAHFSDDALLEFILRKQSGEDKRIKKLKSVNVTFTRRPTVDIMPQLSMHISDGLKISITYPPRTYRGTFSLYDGLPEMDDANPYSQPLFR